MPLARAPVSFDVALFISSMAKTSKGQKFEFETSCAAWVDLLGYGAMLESVGFDPTSETARHAIERVRNFHSLITAASAKLYPTFVMNDGAVAYRDLSPRSREVTYDFIRRSIELHHAIAESEKKCGGYPGARMVIAVGFRVRRLIDFTPRLVNGEAKAIRDRLSRNEISIDQAISQALMARHQADSTPELQHNFAFTKAYLADSAGSKAGLGGPNCFIDLSLFADKLPPWIQFSNSIEWSARGLNATFGQFASVDHGLAREQKFEGVLDAFDIAEKIASSPNAIARIRASRLGDLRALGNGNSVPKG